MQAGPLLELQHELHKSGYFCDMRAKYGLFPAIREVASAQAGRREGTQNSSHCIWTLCTIAIDIFCAKDIMPDMTGR